MACSILPLLEVYRQIVHTASKCVFKGSLCRPVMLKGAKENTCMFQPIPGRRSAPLPPTHKHNESIMDETVCGEAPPEFMLLQATAVSLFMQVFQRRGRSYSIFTHRPCKQPRLLPHRSHLFVFTSFPFLTVVLLGAPFFLLRKPTVFYSPPSLSLRLGRGCLGWETWIRGSHRGLGTRQ